jgi:hypothetical protein
MLHALPIQLALLNYWVPQFLQNIHTQIITKQHIPCKMYYSMQCLPEGFVSKNLIVAAKMHPNIVSWRILDAVMHTLKKNMERMEVIKTLPKMNAV